MVVMKDFNDILILEKTKHKSSVFFYVIILLFLLLPLKSFAQSDQSGVFSTDAGVINSFANTNTHQYIASTTGGYGIYADSSGNIEIGSITVYVKEQLGTVETLNLKLSLSGMTLSKQCTGVSIPANYEGYITADDCGIFSSGVPFYLASTTDFLLTFDVPGTDNVDIGGFTTSHWEAGNCVTNCVTSADHYFSITLDSFGGWYNFIPNDITPPNFDPLFDTSSYIKWVDPVNNEVVSTSSFPIEVEVYIDDKEEDLFPNNFLDYSLVAEFQSYAEAPEIENVYSIVIDDEIKISDILGSVETYYATSSILSTEGFYLSVIKLVPNPYEIITGTYLLSDTIGINVGTTTTDFYEVVSANSLCSDYSFPVDGICRVFVRLFVPQIPFQTYLKQLSETMRSKIPFAYFYRVNDILSDVSGVEKSLSSTDIVIVNPLFGSITFFDWSVLAAQFDNWFSDIWVYFEYLVWAGFVSYLVFRFMYINL